MNLNGSLPDDIGNLERLQLRNSLLFRFFVSLFCLLNFLGLQWIFPSMISQEKYLILSLIALLSKFCIFFFLLFLSKLHFSRKLRRITQYNRLYGEIPESFYLLNSLMNVDLSNVRFFLISFFLSPPILIQWLRIN